MTPLGIACKRRELARSNLANYESTIARKKEIEPFKVDLTTLQRLEEQIFKIEWIFPESRGVFGKDQ